MELSLFYHLACNPTPSAHLLKDVVRVTPVSRSRSAVSIRLPSTAGSKSRGFTGDSRARSPVVSCFNPPKINGAAVPVSPAIVTGGRIGEVKRVAKETDVYVKINLDGTGVADIRTGIPFLDHMLDQLPSHGLFNLHVSATGDTHIDDHHTNEGVALAIGAALLQALGDRKGIRQFGDFSAPLDEALTHVALDLSSGPHLSFDLQIPTQRVGKYETQLVEHFFESLVNTSGMTLHIRQLAGKNSHHIIEATFKAFAKALRQATEYDLWHQGTIPRCESRQYRLVVQLREILSSLKRGAITYLMRTILSLN